MAKQTKQEEARLAHLMLHYNRGTQDVDTRRTRKNGWNDIINAYMSKLPANWPYTSMVTDPRIRTTILEKTSRLLNAKLQGRLIPREGGDVVKSRINNALLDFQWDFADEGGSMIEKVAAADQTSRVFGAAFALVYWNVKKNSNDIKIIDPRDIWFDGGAIHVKNAKWVQVREWTSFGALEDRGYDCSKAKMMVKKGEISSDMQSTAYESIVKANRGLENRVGEQDDQKDPVVECVTEWTKEKCTIFLPRYGVVLTKEDEKNPYKHGKIPLAMLRYYPLGDDIYGESEVECVLPLQRAINAVLCGYLDEMNISMRPPLKISSSGVRIETIEYGPGAMWIMQNPNLVSEMQFSGQAIGNFNATYPALVAAFNNAMGDLSLGVSNQAGKGFDDKTATEVKSSERQQNNRDQYNQQKLSEFLKDIMMMWLSNNKQYLFDDPSKKFHIVKVVGKDNIKHLEQMKLNEMDVPDDAMHDIADTVSQNPDVSDQMLQGIVDDVSIPSNAVITNPTEDNPENYDVRPKLDVSENGEEADLYMTPDDFEGEFDYIPDVSSMAAGAGSMMKEAREKALQFALNPQVVTMMEKQGDVPKIKDLIINILQDAGYRDAESLFTQAQNGQQQGPSTTNPAGPGVTPPGPGAFGSNGDPGIQNIPQTVPGEFGAGGIPQSQGF